MNLCSLRNEIRHRLVPEVFCCLFQSGRFAKENKCDFIVALGGGSVIDASKAIGLMATNESNDLWDYVMFGTGKKQWPPMPALPIVAITTTAGTGSETDGDRFLHQRTSTGTCTFCLSRKAASWCRTYYDLQSILQLFCQQTCM